jgi:hypothetical protein
MFHPATDADVPRIVTLMNRAYRGVGTAGWSTQEPYLSGDRITEEVLRTDLRISHGNPAPKGHNRPDRFHQTKRPCALKKAVRRPQRA